MTTHLTAPGADPALGPGLASTASAEVIAARTAPPREAGRLLRFAAVGVVNTAITVVTFSLLIALQTPAPLASALAFLAGAANSFVVNRRWTFGDLSALRGASWRFLVIQGLGAGLSAAGVGALTRLWASHLLAECAIVPVVTILLYGLSRRLVFRDGA